MLNPYDDQDQADITSVMKLAPPQDQKTSLSSIFPGLSMQDLQAKSDDANQNKKILKTAGSIMQGFENAPTAYELLYNKKVAKPDIAGGLNNIADSIQDPWEKQKKTYEAYKDAKAAKISDESNDPNSETSKAYQDNLRQNFPDMAAKLGDNLSKISAAQMPSFLKPTELKAQIDMKKEIAAGRIEAATERKKAEADHKNGIEIDKLSKAMGKDFDPDAGRTGNFGQISSKVIQADRLKTLISSYKNGDLPPAQMEELSLGLANMLSGTSGAARSQVEALVPHTMWGQVQSAAQYLANEPRGTGQQKFVEAMAHTVDRERALANDQLNSIRAARLSNHNRFKQLAPDQYAEKLQSYGVDPNKIVNGKYQSEQAPSKIKVSNGKEILEIDPSDLEHAMTDGYKQVQQ